MLSRTRLTRLQQAGDTASKFPCCPYSRTGIERCSDLHIQMFQHQMQHFPCHAIGQCIRRVSAWRRFVIVAMCAKKVQSRANPLNEKTASNGAGVECSAGGAQHSRRCGAGCFRRHRHTRRRRRCRQALPRGGVSIRIVTDRHREQEPAEIGPLPGLSWLRGKNQRP